MPTVTPTLDSSTTARAQKIESPPRTPAPTDSRESSRRFAMSIAALGGFILVLAALVLRASMGNQQQPSVQTSNPGAVSKSNGAAATESLEATSKWVRPRQSRWAPDGSRAVAFELAAANDVPVRLTRVRPQLVVRCLYRTTEVFVSIGTAASVETSPDYHTVRVQIDDDPAQVQQWPGSVSQQELFAPDGLAFARRLASAHRVRFGFTPYNATEVNATFLVEGADRPVKTVAQTCGWRPDGGTTAANPPGPKGPALRAASSRASR